MDDSTLVDIYEDLSVDKIYTMSSQTLPSDIIKTEPGEDESKIDLFMEALAVRSIDKVQSQLIELQKDNEKLRCENAELRKSKMQLSKNISSLFLTAKQEIQKKEQEIARLKMIKLQESCESCRLKHVQHNVKDSLDPNSACVSSGFSGCSNKDKPQSDIRNRLSQEISQSYSLSSCQGVACRKKQKVNAIDRQHVHENNHSSVIPKLETWPTITEEQKSHKDTEIAGNKQDTYIKNHYTSKHLLRTLDQQQPHASTLGSVSIKDCQSHSLKNKFTKSVAEIQRFENIQKIETPTISFLKMSSKQKTEKSDTSHLQAEYFSGHNRLSHSKGKTESFGMNSSLLSNSELTFTERTPRQSKHLMVVGTSETENAFFDKSKGKSHLQYNFASVTSKNDSMQLDITQKRKSKTSVEFSSSEMDTVNKETFYDKGSVNRCQTKKLYHHSKPKYSLTDAAALCVRDCIRQERDTSHLDNSLQMTARTDNNTLLHGNDTNSYRKPMSSRKRKRKSDPARDKNSNCNIVESLQRENASSDECGSDDYRDEHVVESTAIYNAEPTYITCTSNLILLGDEETTVTSPGKLQPSEFYPPGVRGDVQEGGSHARHIRGITEVIKKMSNDKCNFFECDSGNAPQNDDIAVNNCSNASENNSRASSSMNCHKTRELTIMHTVDRQGSLCPENKVNNISNCSDSGLSSQTYDDHLEKLREDKTKCNGDNRSVHTCDSDVDCDWACAVNMMFGDVFHKKLCALKEEPALPVLHPKK